MNFKESGIAVLELALISSLMACGSAKFSGASSHLSSARLGAHKSSASSEPNPASDASTPDATTTSVDAAGTTTAAGSADGPKDGSGSADATSTASTATGASNAATGTSSTADEASPCGSLLGVSFTDIVTVRNGSPDVKLTPGSLVLVQATGQAQINLGAAEVASVKGICIWASGGASVHLDTSLVVAGVYYFGRGNAASVIDFGSTGSLAKLVTDIAGTHSLTVKGTQITCSNIVGSQTGASNVQCET